MIWASFTSSFPAVWTAALPLAIYMRSLLHPLALAASASVFALLPGVAGGAIEASAAMIVAYSHRSGEHLAASLAGEESCVLPAILLAVLLSHFLLAGPAHHPTGRHRHHLGLKVGLGLGFSAAGAHHLGALDLHALQAAPQSVRILLDQLCPREGLRDLVGVATVAAVLLQALGLQLPAALRDEAVLAGLADGRLVGSDELPLLLLEHVHLANLLAGAASCTRPLGFPESGPVDGFAAQLLQQEVRTFCRRAALEEELREGPHDEDVFAAADPGGGHGPNGRVHPLVHLQIQEHRA